MRVEAGAYIHFLVSDLGAIACAPADDASLDAGPPVDAGKPLSAMPAIADLEGETHAIEPGGDTICSRGNRGLSSSGRASSTSSWSSSRRQGVLELSDLFGRGHDLQGQHR